MDNNYLEILKQRKQNEIANIKKCNDYISKYGLILLDNQISNILERKSETLKKTGRIELREGVIDKLIKEFCDSPYLNQENFEKNYKGFIEKYNFSDLYTATFYDFKTPEEKWAFWAKLIILNRFNEKPLELYQDLYNLIRKKEHFVITTNADGQFEKAGFQKENLFIVQWDYSLLQCEDGCHNKVYYNETLVKDWIKNTIDCKIPSNLVPKCPVCGKDMEMNLRKDANFVQDENWYKEAQKYEEFLNKAKDKNVVLLEIGVGFNTPSIIKFPFEQMVYNDLKTTLIRINKDYPLVREEIKSKSISFDEDIKKIIEDLKEN